MRRLFPLYKHSMRLIQINKWNTWLKLALVLGTFFLVFSVALICLAAVITVHSLSTGNLATG